MKGEKGLSGRLTLGLAALLCLLFGLSLLLFFPGGASPEPEIQAAASLPERTLTGGGRPAPHGAAARGKTGSQQRHGG